mgnify:FL=1
MTTIEKNQDVSVDENSGGEAVLEETKITLSKEEYDDLKKHETTVGSLKREMKDLKKSLETPKETETPKNQSSEFGLLQKTYLRSAGITKDAEVELARDVQKRTGLEWDKIPEDEYFLSKLQKLRDAEANAIATDVKGGGNAAPTGAKNTPEHWIKKGTPPTPEDIPDRKTRASIIKAMLKHERGGGGKFYNE